MLLALIIALVMGILAGTLTGLTPGIHINLVSLLLLNSSAVLLGFTSPLSLVIFIVSMSITHTFIDYVPSIFLGAPDEDTGLSVLPGHQMLLKGNAYFAVILTLYGGLTALAIIIIFTPIFIFILPFVYPYVVRIMAIILILISAYLIYNEKEKRIWALVIFILSGFLGIGALNIGLKDPLLPLLTGLFGTSGLAISIRQKIKIPRQNIIPLKEIIPEKRSFLKTTFASVIASPFTAFLPGLGASPAAIIGSDVTELNNEEFLFLMGAINTIVMGLSFVTLYAIQKTRTGASVAVSKLIPSLTLSNLFFIIGAMIIAGIASFFIAVMLSKIISKNIHLISYAKLSKIILIFLIIITFYFAGFLGLLILITSTFLGISAILLGVKRTNLMGCLLIPTILFYSL